MNTPLVKRGNRVLSNVLGHYTKLEVSYGRGCHLFDSQGNAYLDFASGIAVNSTGHCHPDVVAAIKHQAETLIHACAGVVYYEPHIALAEKLSELTGARLNNVFFNQSGSEAVETALKLAKYVTKKSKIIAFQGGFHGRTMGSLSITTSKEKYRTGYGNLVPDAVVFPYPYEYRSPWSLDNQSFDAAAIQEFQTYITPIKGDVAAIIIEPVLGEGGYVPAPVSFVKALEKICRANGILLIFDEIQSGIGRTGTWFAYQKYGVLPDIITLAKGIASGMPLGAVMATKELMDKWPTGSHGSTYTGNPVTCAAGLATLAVLEPLLPRVSALGQKALHYLKSELKDNPSVGDIRGMGLMIGIELVTNKMEKTPDPKGVKTAIERCLEKNLIVISCGIHDNVIRLSPPLVIDETTLMDGLSTLSGVLNGLN